MSSLINFWIYGSITYFTKHIFFFSFSFGVLFTLKYELLKSTKPFITLIPFSFFSSITWIISVLLFLCVCILVCRSRNIKIILCHQITFGEFLALYVSFHAFIFIVSNFLFYFLAFFTIKLNPFHHISNFFPVTLLSPSLNIANTGYMKNIMSNCASNIPLSKMPLALHHEIIKYSKWAANVSSMPSSRLPCPYFNEMVQCLSVCVLFQIEKLVCISG